MGVTKQYRRYSAHSVFGVVGSAWAGLQLLDISGRHMVAVGACEHVFVWDVKKGEKALTLEGTSHLVSALANHGRYLSVGYNDGSIRIFDLTSSQVVVTLKGHKSAVTALNYDADGMRLVSGAKDTEVIVWDIVNERGLFRLRGHKGAITQARFYGQMDILITSAKDTLVKFWDLTTQHCFKTLVGHKTEVYDFVLAREGSLLVTGSADMDLRMWRITNMSQMGEDGAPVAKRIKRESADGEEAESDSDAEEEESLVACESLGSITRQGKDRVVSMELDNSGQFLGVHGNDSMLEVFRILSDAELTKLLHRKQKKARKRARETGNESISAELTLDDKIPRITNLRFAGKVRSFQCKVEDPSVTKVVALLANNTIQSLTFDPAQKKDKGTTVMKLHQQGHRSDVRSVCFSSDNTAVLSGSGDTVKIWNRATVQCIRTMSCDYALCSVFAPGDRHVIVGTKSGKLQIFDIAAGQLLESLDAHQGAVWSLCLSPDKRKIVSGSADKMIKFWDFELIQDEAFSATSKRLTLVHTRSLQMSEDVLAVKYSPDYKFLAVALLDNTVKVFFADTLKFFLSLFGHKLPVLCMDISSDSTLIATGSADRNIKLWGLDFGDCHKSIFAHDDSIMCLQFIPKTHMFFSGGKDGFVKQWDGDTFEHIVTLKGHHGEVWSLAVSSSGNFVVSASHDKSLRLWEKSDEPLILEEERETAREEEEEEEAGNDTVVAGETNKETGIAGKKTVDTVKAADRLIEALEVYKEETMKRREHEEECRETKSKVPSPAPHPLLLAFSCDSPDKYVLEVIKKIRSSELEESLLILPFSCVIDLLPLLSSFIHSGQHTELVCRCLFFLLKVHQGQITTSKTLLPVIDELRTTTQTQVTQIRDVIGFNLASLRFLQHSLEQKDEVMMFADATERFEEKKRKQKRRAILTVKT